MNLRAFLLLFLAPGLSYAQTVNFCIRHTGAYEDNDDAPHDFWTDDNPKLARGALVQIFRNYYTPIYYNYLGDGLGGGTGDLGCTGPIAVSAVNATCDFYVRSAGKVQGNDIVALDHATGNYVVAIYTKTVTNGQADQDITIDNIPAGAGFNVLNVYQAGAYAMYRHAAGIGGEVLYYEVDTNVNIPSGAYHADDHMITIRSDRAGTKFEIVHEAGHWISDIRTQAVMIDAIDISYNDATCSAANHNMTSEEWAGGAAGEGYAHFYSADVWNDHNESNCHFEYWGSVGGVSDVNCQDGNDPFDLAYLETNCGSTSQHGVELDWMRAFWDVHTAGAAPDPSFTAVADWLDTAGSWSRSTVYSVLNAEANDVGGDLNTNWDDTKVENGVDH